MRNDESKWNFIRSAGINKEYLIPTLDGVKLDYVTAIQINDEIDELATMTITVHLGEEPK